MTAICVAKNWEYWKETTISHGETLVWPRVVEWGVEPAEPACDTDRFVYVGRANRKGQEIALFAEDVDDWPQRLLSYVTERARRQSQIMVGWL